MLLTSHQGHQAHPLAYFSLACPKTGIVTYSSRKGTPVIRHPQLSLSLATVGAAALVAAVLPSSAEAAAPPQPFQDVVHITNNYDNSHGPWASLNYNRSVKITWAGPGKWNVALTDAGTFRTLQGKHSPGVGSAITSAQNGTFKGTFDFKVTSATPPSGIAVHNSYNYACNMNGSGNRAVDCPGMPKGTSEWPALYFPAGTVTAGNWSWGFDTCREHWTTKNTGNSGDITGKSCQNDSHDHNDGDNGHGDDHGNDHGDNSHGNDHGHQPQVKKVHVTAPIFKAATCHTSAYVRVTPVRGVQWYVNNHHANSVTKVNTSTVTVSAKPLKGYDVVGTDNWKQRMHKPYCQPVHNNHDNHSNNQH